MLITLLIFITLLLAACTVVPLLLGLFTLYHLMRAKQRPADTSNRINHIRLWWFALTREDKFVGLFPWMARDEWDNVKK